MKKYQVFFWLFIITKVLIFHQLSFGILFYFHLFNKIKSQNQSFFKSKYLIYNAIHFTYIILYYIIKEIIN